MSVVCVCVCMRVCVYVCVCVMCICEIVAVKCGGSWKCLVVRINGLALTSIVSMDAQLCWCRMTMLFFACLIA